MTDDLTYTFTVDQSPAEAFAAICDVRAWWSGDIEGRTDVFGAEWSYGCPTSTSARSGSPAGPRPVARLAGHRQLASFTEDQQEWTGTTVRFDVSPPPMGPRSGSRTTGWPRRSSATACAGSPGASTSSAACAALIESGAGRPDSYEDLDVAREAARATP